MIHKIIKYSKNSIRLLKQSLENGNIIAVPTYTVYGLIADAYNEKAVNKIFRTKLRPKKLPLIIFVSSIKEAKKIGHFSKYDELLANAFWPGDLTLIVKKKSNKRTKIVQCFHLCIYISILIYVIFVIKEIR